MRKRVGEPAMNDSSVVAVPWLDLEHELASLAAWIVA